MLSRIYFKVAKAMTHNPSFTPYQSRKLTLNKLFDEVKYFLEVTEIPVYGQREERKSQCSRYAGVVTHCQL